MPQSLAVLHALAPAIDHFVAPRNAPLAHLLVAIAAQAAAVLALRHRLGVQRGRMGKQAAEPAAGLGTSRRGARRGLPLGQLQAREA